MSSNLVSCGLTGEPVGPAYMYADHFILGVLLLVIVLACRPSNFGHFRQIFWRIIRPYAP